MWVVSYDIASDKRRRKVMKKVLGCGKRVQFSVFECDVSHQRILKLAQDLDRIIDDTVDSVRMYPLNKADMDRAILLGGQGLYQSSSHYVV
jgi:CRISPR-associated protein Cas2